MRVNGELQVAQLEQIASASPTPAARGRAYSNITNGSEALPMFYNGSIWVPMQQVPSIDQASNYAVGASVSGGAMTISVLDRNGSALSTSSKAVFGMRSNTLTSGAVSRREASSISNLVVSAGSTLGTKNGQTYYLWVLLIDNSGTLEPAITMTLPDEGSLITTTAEGGAGGADSNSAIYSTTARTNVPWRLIARLTVSESTAGTWSNGPSNIAVGTYGSLSSSDHIFLRATNSFTTPGATNTDILWATTITDTHGAFDGTSWTCPKTDHYFFALTLRLNAASISAGQYIFSAILINGSTLIGGSIVSAGGTADTFNSVNTQGGYLISAGSTVKVQCGSTATTPSIDASIPCGFTIARVGR